MSRPWHIMLKNWAIMLCFYALKIILLCFISQSLCSHYANLWPCHVIYHMAKQFESAAICTSRLCWNWSNVYICWVIMPKYFVIMLNLDRRASMLKFMPAQWSVTTMLSISSRNQGTHAHTVDGRPVHGMTAHWQHASLMLLSVYVN